MRSFGHPDLAQHLAHVVRLELLHAGKVDLRDRRALAHEHHEHVAFGFQAHILEETGGVQRAQRSARPFRVHRLPDLDRQVAEHRAGSVRCRPSTRMSFTTKGWNSWAGRRQPPVKEGGTAAITPVLRSI